MLKKLVNISLNALGRINSAITAIKAKEPQILAAVDHVEKLSESESAVTLYKKSNAVNIVISNDNYNEALIMLSSASAKLLEDLRKQGIAPEIHDKYVDLFREGMPYIVEPQTGQVINDTAIDIVDPVTTKQVEAEPEPKGNPY